MSLPPVEVPQGAIRFNTDSQKLEFFAQDQWFEMVIDTPDLAVGSNTGAGARGLFGGGYNPSNPAPSANRYENVIDYLNITSTGNAQDFGDLTSKRMEGGSLSSATRGIFAGGETGPSAFSTAIDFITISSTGDATSFGSLSTAVKANATLASATRGIFAGGTVPTINAISYITIASTGSAISFGQLSTGRTSANGCASSTRGVFGGGQNPGSPVNITVNIIEYVTISTLGNATDFGDLTQARNNFAALSNSTRGVWGGGTTPTAVTTIDFINIASLGNAIKFGDLVSSINNNQQGACSSPTRGLFGGGAVGPASSNTIEYITILTQGNAVDFGDLTRASSQRAALSNAHGGL